MQAQDAQALRLWAPDYGSLSQLTITLTLLLLLLNAKRHYVRPCTPTANTQSP